jgi:hypothetical protein
VSNSFDCLVLPLNSTPFRKRRELRVFRKLLQIVPGLEDRLANPEIDEEDVMDIADLVRSQRLGYCLLTPFFHFQRFSRALPELGQMIPRASKV